MGDFLNIFDLYTIPLRDWVDVVVDWARGNARWFFQALRVPVDFILENIRDFLRWLPPLVVVLAMGAVAWRVAGRGVAIFGLASLLLLGFLGIWDLTMVTLAMIVSAVFFCAAIGIPLGILAARSDRFEAFLRPALDAMQTTPPFVYLVPVAVLIGIGTTPGVMATIIFALPPIIRLTNLGIRQVDYEVVEAAFAFGATPRQVLIEVQVPLAMRTIMAGLNQTLMLAMSMVVLAAIIGAGGLGNPVRQGLNNLDAGVGFVGGLGIVLLAILLDRITQALGQGRRSVKKESILTSMIRGLRGHPVQPQPSGNGSNPEATAASASRTRRD